MSDVVFVDTSAWFAAVVPGDANPAAAAKWFAENRRPLATTDYVVDETLTLLRMRGENQLAITLGTRLFAGQLATVHYLTPEQILAAWQIFSSSATRTGASPIAPARLSSSNWAVPRQWHLTNTSGSLAISPWSRKPTNNPSQPPAPPLSARRSYAQLTAWQRPFGAVAIDAPLPRTQIGQVWKQFPWTFIHWSEPTGRPRLRSGCNEQPAAAQSAGRFRRTGWGHLVDAHWTDTDFVIRFSNTRLLHIWACPGQVRWQIVDTPPEIAENRVRRVGAASAIRPLAICWRRTHGLLRPYRQATGSGISTTLCERRWAPALSPRALDCCGLALFAGQTPTNRFYMYLRTTRATLARPGRRSDRDRNHGTFPPN